jgi:site-specific recombinase XerC
MGDPLLFANIRMLQTLLGHKNVKTTEIYTHVMSTQFTGITNPLDALLIPHDDDD